MLDTGMCRSCCARVIWGVALDGKSVQLDAEPHPEGLIHLREDGGCEVMTYAQKATALEVLPSTPFYRPHSSTCTNPAENRRKKK